MWNVATSQTVKRCQQHNTIIKAVQNETFYGAVGDFSLHKSQKCYHIMIGR